jgi:hypothetical protein
LTHLIKNEQEESVKFLLKELKADVDFVVYRDPNSKSMPFTAIFTAIETDLERYVTHYNLIAYVKIKRLKNIR